MPFVGPSVPRLSCGVTLARHGHVRSATVVARHHGLSTSVGWATAEERGLAKWTQMFEARNSSIHADLASLLFGL